MSEVITYGLEPAPPNPEPRLAGVILAGGSGERIGTNKALLPFRDTTFIQHLLQIFRDSGLNPIYAVLGPGSEEVRALLPTWARYTVNPKKKGTPLYSVQAGLNALGGVGNAAVIGLVDQPLLDPQTLPKLCDVWRATRAQAVVPCYRGERGHPVVLSRSAFPAVFRAGGSTTLRDVLGELGGDVAEVEIDDPAILLNINNPADYRRLIDLYGLPHEKHLGDSWEGYIANKSKSGRE